MNKYIKIAIVAVLSLILLSLIIYIILYTSNNGLYKYKCGKLENANAEEIAKQIHILDDDLTYESFEKNLNEKTLKEQYVLNDKKKVDDLDFDAIRYNSEVYFALIKDLDTLVLEVKYLNGDGYRLYTYSNKKHDDAKITYSMTKNTFNKKVKEMGIN